MTDVVCGHDAVPRRIVKRNGWWLVEESEDAVSGGFRSKTEAIAEAKRLGATDD